MKITPAGMVDASIPHRMKRNFVHRPLIGYTGPPDWLLAIDFQAGHDMLAKLADLLVHNSALFKRHRLQVRSLLVLSNGPSRRGRARRQTS